MKFAFLGAFLAGAAFSAQAAETASAIPHFEFPDEYRVSAGQQAAAQAAPARESTQGFSGVAHTVVAPVFDGANGNTSYVRLANLSTAPAIITVTVVGTPSGRDYGSFTYNVPASASQQKSIHDILREAGITPGYIAPDTGYSLYLSTTSREPVGFQHILHNANSRFFENMSVCTYRANMDYSALNQFVGNAHTDHDIMRDYPTNISIHHYGPAPAFYLVDVYVSETGEWKGNFTFTLQPNETFVAPMSYYEQRVNWVPQYGQSHANLVFRRNEIGQYEAVVGQRVYNAALDASINMSQFCGLNPE
jgi:hypothetical protein